MSPLAGAFLLGMAAMIGIARLPAAARLVAAWPLQAASPQPPPPTSDVLRAAAPQSWDSPYYRAIGATNQGAYLDDCSQALGGSNVPGLEAVLSRLGGVCSQDVTVYLNANNVWYAVATYYALLRWGDYSWFWENGAWHPVGFTDSPPGATPNPPGGGTPTSIRPPGGAR